jgi:hypothetical protein
MTDWFEGQKIVCVNAHVPPQYEKGLWTGISFIKKLNEGQIYTIDKIAMIHYEGLASGGAGDDIGFLLKEIDTNYTKNSMPQIDKYGEEFYHFWNGRFRPLDEIEKGEKVDISVFQTLLNDVNDGKVKFDDEDGGLKAPSKELENV